MTAEEIRAAIAPHRWLHAIDLGQGVTTPGLWSHGAQAHIERLMDRVDYTGKRVLDVGTCDGRWAFEAEKRGAASVLTIDIEIDRWPTFEVAKAILGSWVERQEIEVESVHTLPRNFDLIQFFGVYYHLRHPLLALESLHEVLFPGGVLLVEGAVAGGTVLAARFVRDRYQGDPTNWWIPTVPCLIDWVESSGFAVTWQGGPVPSTDSRYTLVAEKREP